MVSLPTRKASVKVQTSPSHNLGSMFSLVDSLACASGSGNQEQGVKSPSEDYFVSVIIYSLVPDSSSFYFAGYAVRLTLNRLSWEEWCGLL